MPEIRIVVDVHERQSGIADVLVDELGASVEVAPLPAHDYAVGEDTLVERKRVLDLHGAVLKGRLWPQLAKLRAAAPFPYLLVEGTDIDRGPLAPAAIRGVCLAAIDQGIALLRSGRPRDSALWIHRLALRCQRIEAAPERPVYAQRPKAALAPEALLASVPGISTAGARALLERFGSVAAIATARPEAWLEVAGIGAERARAIAAALGVPAPATASRAARSPASGGPLKSDYGPERQAARRERLERSALMQ